MNKRIGLWLLTTLVLGTITFAQANLKTAKQIGLTIPQWTLMKADKVIK